jgi:6-pyruvoyltetrahydropterin/6-carboxytetrahydropterin synthase
MAKYQSIKNYGNDRGLSCTFRQWRADHSHCSTLHGYSLGVEFTFESETLDSRQWCFDFGGMKPIKAWLDFMFDHTTVIAQDDPALEMFKNLALYSTIEEHNGKQSSPQDWEAPFAEGRVIDLRIVDGVGCELFAKMIFEKTEELINGMKSGKNTRYDINPDVRLTSVKVYEHGANAARYSK